MDEQDQQADRTDEQTREADRADGEVQGGADRAPTTDEERLAEQSAAGVDVESVGEHYSEMAELGAQIDGEGKIGG